MRGSRSVRGREERRDVRQSEQGCLRGWECNGELSSGFFRQCGQCAGSYKEIRHFLHFLHGAEACSLCVTHSDGT